MILNVAPSSNDNKEIVIHLAPSTRTHVYHCIVQVLFDLYLSRYTAQLMTVTIQTIRVIFCH